MEPEWNCSVIFYVRCNAQLRKALSEGFVIIAVTGCLAEKLDGSLEQQLSKEPESATFHILKIREKYVHSWNQEGWKIWVSREHIGFTPQPVSIFFTQLGEIETRHYSIKVEHLIEVLKTGRSTVQNRDLKGGGGGGAHDASREFILELAQGNISLTRFFARQLEHHWGMGFMIHIRKTFGNSTQSIYWVSIHRDGVKRFHFCVVASYSLPCLYQLEERNYLNSGTTHANVPATQHTFNDVTV